MSDMSKEDAEAALRARAEKAEEERDALETAREILGGLWAKAEAERDRLAAQLAEAQAQVAALRAERDGFRRNLRESFEAMCAMRDAINEHVPMPSLESDLLQGPEPSVFCAAVAEAVVARLAAAEAQMAALRAERDGLLTTWAESRERHLKAEAERDDLRARLAAVEGQVAALTEAAANLMRVFPEPCRHDHHGYCQEHFIESECSVLALKNALATVTPPADTTEGGE